jgi:hypothetical protein
MAGEQNGVDDAALESRGAFAGRASPRERHVGSRDGDEFIVDKAAEHALRMRSGRLQALQDDANERGIVGHGGSSGVKTAARRNAAPAAFIRHAVAASLQRARRFVGCTASDAPQARLWCERGRKSRRAASTRHASARRARHAMRACRGASRFAQPGTLALPRAQLLGHGPRFREATTERLGRAAASIEHVRHAHDPASPLALAQGHRAPLWWIDVNVCHAPGRRLRVKCPGLSEPTEFLRCFDGVGTKLAPARVAAVQPFFKTQVGLLLAQMRKADLDWRTPP